MATEALVSAAYAAAPSAFATAARSESLRTDRRRIDLGGLLIDHVDLAMATDRVAQFLRSGRPHQIVTVNLDFISIASQDPLFRATINEADLAVADGMPLVWVSRLKGSPLQQRVAGVDLVAESCRVAAEMRAGVFLLGGKPGIAELAAQRLDKDFPGLRVVGTHCPPVGPLLRKDNDRALRKIRDARPDLLLVALGAPRQDLWIREHQPHLEVPVAMGVGCVLDLLAGSVNRAPRWMQRVGLEWAFRLGQEPQRLWRRYLINDVPTFGRLLWDGRRQGAGALVVSS